MARHDGVNLTYASCENELLDKELASTHFILSWLDKLSMMFDWRGLPKTMPKRYLEYYLLTNGNCLACKADNGDLYCFTGGLSGQEMSPYYEPTEYIVANPALNLFKTFKIDVDGILIRNDSKMLGIMPILRKYCAILIESDITGRNCLVNMRMQRTISASDNKTYQSALQYMDSVKNGKLAVIAETPFLDGLKINDITSNTAYFQGLVEVTQYFRAQFLNEIGLNANYNMKREYISDSENVLNDDVLLPFADNMLSERKDACDKINEMFGTDVTVDFASSWKTNAKENVKQVAIADNVIGGGNEESGSENENAGGQDDAADNAGSGNDGVDNNDASSNQDAVGLTLTESSVESDEANEAGKDITENENAVTGQNEAVEEDISKQPDNAGTDIDDDEAQVKEKDDEEPTV